MDTFWSALGHLLGRLERCWACLRRLWGRAGGTWAAPGRSWAALAWENRKKKIVLWQLRGLDSRCGFQEIKIDGKSMKVHARIRPEICTVLLASLSSFFDSLLKRKMYVFQWSVAQNHDFVCSIFESIFRWFLGRFLDSGNTFQVWFFATPSSGPFWIDFWLQK